LATLRILSAGAAQAVTERLMEAFRRETGHNVAADFGAVGVMKSRVTGGEPVDLVILTRALIEELVAASLVRPGSRVDLGKVGTGVAVRAGTPVPDISDADLLRVRILTATRIVFPDPAVATAGKVVMNLLEKLGVLHEVGSRVQLFPNGYAAMKWLAQTQGTGALGITQVTEILPNAGVSYAGPLPEPFQMKAIYSAALAANARELALAEGFIARFQGSGARSLLIEAGYEV
jgi:molybdate transport system substrate-binding protein